LQLQSVKIPTEHNPNLSEFDLRYIKILAPIYPSQSNSGFLSGSL
jgi:hypothetical protein